MKEERKGKRGTSKRAERAQRVPEGNSRDSSMDLTENTTPHDRKRHRAGGKKRLRDVKKAPRGS
jgi:hypothetical protein